MMLTTRPIVIYDLPLPSDTVIVSPEFAIIRFPNNRTVDIGCLCYLNRKLPEIPNGKAGSRLVQIDSLNESRKEQVISLIHHISNSIQHSGKRVATIKNSVSRFLSFMGWADANGFEIHLIDTDIARLAVQSYARYISDRVMTNSISLNAGAHQQSSVFNFLEDFLGVDALTHGINRLRVNRATTKSTSPPNELVQGKVLTLSASIFEGFTGLILNSQLYPYALDVPPYLNFPANKLWIFPTVVWFMSHNSQSNMRKRSTWTYDYENGRVATFSELQANDGRDGLYDTVRRQNIRKATIQIRTANADFRNTHRIQQGICAHNVFIILFLAQTGMSMSQVIDLTWSNSHEISAAHQGFRIIKWRASGKVVFFELPTAFMKQFKRFLALREFLLSGKDFGWLFINFGVKGTREPRQMQAGVCGDVFKFLKRIDPDIDQVLSRQWRAAKSDWLIRNTDPSTAALVLQNSAATILASYATGSEVSHLNEMSSFLDNVAATILPIDAVLDGTVSAVGVCTDYGNPKQIYVNPVVLPKCKELEGCLFCDKFRVHADEKDIRKLVSCRYCLKQTAQLSSSVEQYQSMVAPLIDRINSLLTEIALNEDSLVSKVIYEVEIEGELDIYWARKYEMLQDLDLIL